MELDELKKSWNALNEQLQKEPIADEQQITELIAGYKANTRKSLGRLVVIQRFSIGIGTICLATLLLIWLLLPTFGFNEQLQEKIVPFLGFIAISILAGMWWDWKTYRWNKNTHIEEMSVAEVSRRMTTFRQWTKYEVMGISIWSILFNILYGTFAGITRFDTKEVEYRSANIPEGFDGYRIVQISDIHIGSWQGNPDPIKQLVDLVNGQKPDLIVFTGDLVNQQSHELDGFQEILSQLYAPDGVYSILGNHDYGSYYHWQSPKAEIANLDYLIRQQKAMGWKLLNNEHDILYHKGDSIALIGVENDGEPPFSQFADLPQAMQGTEGMFQILLSHNPTHWRREVLPRSDISLMLAGHTHAMQGILFGHSLAELIYPEWRGMYYEGKRALYVNIGIGYVGLPFRFGAWPEITVLKLVREKE